jgi:hypothetical protein
MMIIIVVMSIRLSHDMYGYPFPPSLKPYAPSQIQSLEPIIQMLVMYAPLIQSKPLSPGREETNKVLCSLLPLLIRVIVICVLAVLLVI